MRMSKHLRVPLLALAGLACRAEFTLAATDAETQQESPVRSAGVVHPCGGKSQVIAQALAMSDAEAACVGVSRALEFLAHAGLDGPPSLTIEVVPEMPDELAGKAVGCYLPEKKRVLLLSFDAFQAGGGWFRMPPSLELYQAAAAHEMAHAVVGCHSEPKQLPVAAQEYIAYVVFFATMDPQLRAALLIKFSGTGFKTAGQISDINHIVNPNQFGVDSWRHYLRAKNRVGWLRQVVAGDVVPVLFEDPDASSR